MAASSLGFERALPAAHRFHTWRLFYFFLSLRRALYGAQAAPPSYAARRLARGQVLYAFGPSGNTDPREPLPRTEVGLTLGCGAPSFVFVLFFFSHAFFYWRAVGFLATGTGDGARAGKCDAGCMSARLVANVVV
ncbi:hypothetical protein NDU88_004307 [Pleurodeles waltl]|uniref:Uncharacterized protein n=1 Tax=Pleurodeles waltl TaxID=8319 RepID=A0AAV7T7T2_PLEWA|nr:hypothetical protein NDU88_004307 [Pleurodeles waltl]